MALRATGAASRRREQRPYSLRMGASGNRSNRHHWRRQIIVVCNQVIMHLECGRDHHWQRRWCRPGSVPSRDLRGCGRVVSVKPTPWFHVSSSPCRPSL